MTEGNIKPKPAGQNAANILPRIAAGERTAVQECIDTYGGLVWSLARKLSPTSAEAEDAEAVHCANELAAHIGGHFERIAKMIRRVRFQN